MINNQSIEALELSIYWNLLPARLVIIYNRPILYGYLYTIALPSFFSQHQTRHIGRDKFILTHVIDRALQ
jgi:hypothetical protein